MAIDVHIRISDREIAVRTGELARSAELPLPARQMPADELVAALTPLLADVPRAGSTTLTLPASWCYVHTCSVPQRRPTRAVLTYALEEFLPVEAECLTADFVRTAAGEHIGIAVETQRLLPLIAGLQALSLAPECIT